MNWKMEPPTQLGTYWFRLTPHLEFVIPWGTERDQELRNQP